MKFKRNFIENEWARIPFSVIGIFLIIGSSFTTVYVTQLEEENSVEIASTLNFSEVESFICYMEADIARSLNYAACSAFEEIGKNPVLDGYQTTEYNVDATFDGDITYVDANLNIARDITKHAFNNYLSTNFMKNRYLFDEYAINVLEPVDSWQDIKIEIIEMDLNRALNRPIQKPKSTYRVYPVLTITLDLEVKKLGNCEEVLTKRVDISTIINSRYLLLEDITAEFEERLDGTFGALGVDVLAGAMSLTWLRGYSQYALNTPSNIISNEWLEILTNGGILLEEGFVFNSADPIGIVYVGYETAETVADELGYDLGDKFDGLKKAVGSPADSTNFNDAYKENFNDMLPSSEMKDAVDDNLDNISTEYTIQCNTSNLCEEEFNNLLQGQTIPDAIKNIYNALIKILTNRQKTSDNLADIQNNLTIKKTDSNNYEETRSGDAEANANVPAGWNVTSVNLVSSRFYDESEDKEEWNVLDEELISDSGFFDNSNLDLITLDGEQWRIKKERNIYYSWNVETTWRIRAENETDSDVFTVVLESADYAYDDTQKTDEDITIKFVTEEYSNGLIDLDGNGIIQPFETFVYDGMITRDDPNLNGALAYYKDSNHLNWDSSFREKIFKDDDDKYADGSYNDELLVESEEDSKLHEGWLDAEILFALEYIKLGIVENVTAESTVGQGTMPDDLVSGATEKLLNAYLVYKPVILDELTANYIDAGLYKGTASKAIFYLSNFYLDAIGKRLDDEHNECDAEITDTTDDAIEGKNVDSGYDSIKSDMSDADLLSGITIPIGATLTLTHHGDRYSTWSEDVSFSIKQNPPYFSKEYYENSPLDGKQFDNYIKYRNLNIFSPMAGVTCIVEDSFDALNEQILGSIDSGFEELDKIQDSTIRAELESNLNSIVSSISDELTTSLKDALIDEQGYVLSNNNLLEENEIENIVIDVLNQHNGDSQDFTSDLNSDVIKNKITDEINNKVQENLIDKFGSDYPFLSDLQNSASETIVHQVTNAYDKAVTKVLVTVQDKIKDTYESFSSKIEGKIEKKLTTSLSKFVPSGLPILPPFGWWVTINAWYIEVEGEIPEFKVVDSSNEAFVDPILGHNSQEYNRVFAPVFIDFDGDGFKEKEVGTNLPISFAYNTGTFIIVPPGKTGVGDRSGGMDETYSYGTKSS